ncbi:MAG TPA: hypothetical protein VGO69_10005 [Pyrinomonadaceae bacterium]|nr:hypothetical protein [Pyrinomonadaceae bacterium]
MTEIIETTRGIRCTVCGTINWPTAMSCMGCTTTLDKRRVRETLSYSANGDMTFSQSLARFFEVIDFILLVPACFGLLMLLPLVAAAPLFVLAIMIWSTAGCFLLRGFFRHSRGRLSDNGIAALWWAAIGYNLVDLVVLWVLALHDRAPALYYVGLWPLLVVVFSALALISEQRRAKRY